MFGVNDRNQIERTSIDEALSTFEKLDSIDAQVAMLNCYIKDTGLTSGSDFYAVKQTVEDNVVATTRVAKLMRQFMDNRILELSGYNLSEFLDLPVYFSELLVKECKRISGKEKKLLDDMDDDVVRKIGQLKK